MQGLQTSGIAARLRPLKKRQSRFFEKNSLRSAPNVPFVARYEKEGAPERARQKASQTFTRKGYAASIKQQSC